MGPDICVTITIIIIKVLRIFNGLKVVQPDSVIEDYFHNGRWDMEGLVHDATLATNQKLADATNQKLAEQVFFFKVIVLNFSINNK